MAAIEAGQDFQSVAALVIFCLAVAAVLLLVLWPLHLTVPCVYVGQRCGGLWPITFVPLWKWHKQPKLPGPSGGGHAAAAASLAPEPLRLPLPYCWAPVAGIALMLLCQSMSWADVWRGLVGDDRIMPYGIMVGARPPVLCTLCIRDSVTVTLCLLCLSVCFAPSLKPNPV